MGILPNIRRTNKFIEDLQKDFTYKVQAADSIEQFSNLSWVLIPDLFHDFNPGIYQMGYRLSVERRISGTSTLKNYISYTTVKESAYGVAAVPNTDVGFGDGVLSNRTVCQKGGYHEDDGRLDSTVHDWYDDNIIITDPIRLSLAFAKEEFPAGGGVGVKIRGNGTGAISGDFVHPSHFFFRKIADV